MNDSTHLFPADFVARDLQVSIRNNKICIKKNGKSTYSEYTEKDLWDEEILNDTYEVCKKIITHITNTSLDETSYNNKKIVSLDIRATTWGPKAREGFVSVLGICILDLKTNKKGIVDLEVKQFFNMNRKKEDAPKLLELTRNSIEDADILLIFNKGSTIQILKRIIEDNDLNFEFPKNIVDLNRPFINIEELEENLNEITGFQRVHSFNSDYGKYYKSFKGRTSREIDKEIDPIGITNIINVLEFLFIFLIMDKPKIKKQPLVRTIKKLVTEEVSEIFDNIIEMYLSKTQPLPSLIEEERFMEFVEIINKNPFNSNQRDAILSPYNKPCYIVAGPGSGKTTVLVFRILKFIFVDGLLPENILATTFTKKAARELKGRIIDKGYQLVELIKRWKGDDSYQKILKKFDLNRIIVGTLDGICEEILVHDFRPTVVQLNPIDEVVAKGIFRRKGLEETIKAEGYDRSEIMERMREFATEFEGAWGMNYRKLIEFLKNIHDRLVQEQISLKTFEEHLSKQSYNEELIDIVIKIYRNYKTYLEINGLLDFGLLEEKFLQNLNEPTYDIFVSQLKAILVDEYQDTNYLQERIYFSLAKKTNGAITVVGDDDQSLYRFRGAIVNLIKYFPTRIKDELDFAIESEPIYLNINYRSTRTIIDFYNAFLQLDDSYYNRTAGGAARIEGKPLVAFPGNGDETEDLPIILLLKDDVIDLAVAIGDIINDIFNGSGITFTVNGSGDSRKITIQRGREEKNIYIDAVLLASSPRENSSSGNPTLMNYLRAELENHGIKVFNPRGFEIQEIFEVRILLGLILLCLDPSDKIRENLGTYDEVRALIRSWRLSAIQFASDNIEKGTESKLDDFIKHWQKRESTKKTQKWPQSVPILELLYKLSTWLPIFHNDPEYILYLESIVSLIDKIAEFSPWRSEFTRFIIKDGNRIDIEEACIKDFYYNFFISIANGDLELNEDLIENIPEDRFNIMSIHQSKGLEFPLVFVDVCSSFKINSSGQRFKRFPDKISGSYAYEEILSEIQNSPIDGRTILDHMFDDLVRQNFVAYSRTQSLLILVGINPTTKSFRNKGLFLPNVALGFSRDSYHHWNRKDGNYPWYENNDLEE
ncbi:hypothetical protein LCGC14_0816000 [marine sediment metagenome]|uniref:UvrD-like helicase ATP-binding domain-containing protein n=1 Tax=marine sediment metagenome TaxID=412755 RepID=A0A0F9S561_9ZZZZ